MKKRYSIPLFILILIVVVIGLIKIPRYHYKAGASSEPIWGVTFSKKFAEELGLETKEAYTSLLDELNVSHVRIPVYWDDIEASNGEIILNEYVWLIEEAEKRGRNVVLAVGARLPRWPECHIPDWAEELTPHEYKVAVLQMVESVVTEFKEYDSITAWQVENEPLVSWFGECPQIDSELVKQEIEFVRSIDERPIIVTDSGELGTWKKTYALGGDILGVTTYRVTWNPWFSYVRYPMPPSFYRLRAFIAGVPWQNIQSMELQAEPWPPGKNITEISEKEIYKTLDVEQFRSHIEYARAMGVSHAYLWGAEWWYWLKNEGNDSMWNVAAELWN